MRTAGERQPDNPAADDDYTFGGHADGPARRHPRIQRDANCF